MKKEIVIFSLVIIFLMGFLFYKNKKSPIDIKTIEATVLSKSDHIITLESKNMIYTTDKDININIGDKVILEYANIFNNNLDVISYQVISEKNTNIPKEWQDNGIFSDYYIMAYNELKKMSIDEKISQLFLTRYESDAINLKKYPVGGFVFFEKDFKNKTKKNINMMIDNLQKSSKYPLITATDEEGGTIVRASSNKLLRKEKFKSPQELYKEGGFELIKEDTINKSNFLYDLGINTNLAPVVDISTDPNDYIYPRSIGQNKEITSEYAKTVIDASKGRGVSYVLKHFPGYANNIDTHNWVSIDNRSIEEINDSLEPFKEGIKVGAEAILVNHNIVKKVDSTNPASLSINVHNLLRNDLSFSGIIVTDDISMSALDNVSNKSLKALLSGNDLIITSDFQSGFDEIKNALTLNEISIDLINHHVFRILAWKYFKGIMIEEK